MSQLTNQTPDDGDDTDVERALDTPAAAGDASAVLANNRPDDDEDLPSMPDGLPAVPKTAAVKRLAENLKAFGLSDGAAIAIARVIARPEEARRRLLAPDLMR